MASAPSASRSTKGRTVGGGRVRGAMDTWQRSWQPLVSILLGAALGLVDAASSGSAMGLRVPALLSAFLMVAQGMLDLNRNRQQGSNQSGPPDMVQGRVVGPGSQALQPHGDLPREPVYMPPVSARATKESLTVPLLVLGLAVWLGLSVIALDGDGLLRTLSLLSAFLLFNNGWGLLPARK